MTKQVRLAAGDQLPEFTLTDDAGNTFSARDLLGRKAVIFTFPRAFTPGCTQEARDMRDSQARIQAAGYTVLGISADTPEKLAEFRAKYALPYRLLSDPEHRVQAALGAYGEKKNYGRVVQGAIRSTFLVDEEGRLIDALYNVKATGHVDRLLKKLTE